LCYLVGVARGPLWHRVQLEEIGQIGLKPALVVSHHQEYKYNETVRKKKIGMRFEGIRTVLRHRDHYVLKSAKRG